MSFLFATADTDRILGTDAAGVTPTGTSWSAGCWIKLTSLHNGKCYAKWHDNGGVTGFEWLLSVNSSGKIIAATYDSNFRVITGATTLSTGTWYHLVLVQSGTGAGTLVLYLNNVSDGTESPGGTPQNTATPVKIGAGGDGSTQDEPFDGKISRPFFANAKAISGTQRSNLLTQDPDVALGGDETFWTIGSVNEVVDYVGASSLTNTGAAYDSDEPFGGGGGGGNPWYYYAQMRERTQRLWTRRDRIYVPAYALAA